MVAASYGALRDHPRALGPRGRTRSERPVCAVIQRGEDRKNDLRWDVRRRRVGIREGRGDSLVVRNVKGRVAEVHLAWSWKNACSEGYGRGDISE